MKASKNGFVFHVSDVRIKSFKSKAKFIESQVKDFEGTCVDPELIREVSADMYDSLFPPKGVNS